MYYDPSGRAELELHSPPSQVEGHRTQPVEVLSEGEGYAVELPTSAPSRLNSTSRERENGTLEIPYPGKIHKVEVMLGCFRSG